MNGIWNAESAKHHQSSLKFAKWLAGYLPKHTPVVDFGCGNGYYMGYLESEGFDATGIDGNDEIEILCSKFEKWDLADTVVRTKYGSVVSLEVGEHIPKKEQLLFILSITHNCKKHLILSWASIGQPGIGHINCRDQKEVIADIESRGFKLNKEATAEARQNVDDNCDWLQRNLLVFERI
jgi:2-polyprenyl-3-methyl-5-hydroxy-6-metoxy-1,4-benzoquinol methylase